jgi:hypothetical protein
MSVTALAKIRIIAASTLKHTFGIGIVRDYTDNQECYNTTIQRPKSG